MIRDLGQSKLPRTGLAALLAGLDIPGEIKLPDSSTVAVGTGEPLYKVTFRTKRSLKTPMTELGVGRAFVAGDIHVEGDIGALFDAREKLREKVPLRQKVQFLYDFVRTATTMNAKAIGDHYSRGDDFYLTFIDKRFRFYSHGLFQRPDETIEEASEHKLESMFNGLGLKEGMRILDIGGGWGGITQYCGPRGVHVTTLTIAPDSARFIQRLIEDKNLPGQVFLQDFLLHKPDEPYDHAVMYGVIEHIPNYQRFARTVWDVLKPGGRIYLDGSAAIEKFAVSSFTRDYIWRGTHTFMTIQDVMAEFLYHGFEILDVTRETRDYELTMLEWAKRLDAAKEDIIAGWGKRPTESFDCSCGEAHMHSRPTLYRLITSSRSEHRLLAHVLLPSGALSNSWVIFGK
ncbi:S-adenosyl-L-methionine-dependent methyltransferase [Penicillium macrosclerotiorum]|uniref:S-adenosyl-L-methionine-dependent methyltransferase n=1 Tax=Penicillium macrosclerotiorum TaxID=303699 RepID=UPI00254838B0|nr:S-adenosyl-L-methionine-dependent methyltransferase [Penicillium macrosclerotiorum]KAJ5675768.1 S-adenosyl-L-methionine-dependent methyltransferase [Penicillium macrosclerotiorum]